MNTEHNKKIIQDILKAYNTTKMIQHSQWNTPVHLETIDNYFMHIPQLLAGHLNNEDIGLLRLCHAILSPEFSHTICPLPLQPIVGSTANDIIQGLQKLSCLELSDTVVHTSIDNLFTKLIDTIDSTNIPECPLTEKSNLRELSKILNAKVAKSLRISVTQESNE